MHAKKAQSATEYLMTYGWAILAISAVGFLIYSYVFSERDCTSGPNGFPLVGAVVPDKNEYSVSTDGSISILLQNLMDKDISVASINSIPAGDVAIASGEKAAFFLGAGTMAAGTRGKCYTLPISITYDTDKLSGIVSAGTLNGRYG